ncbi:ATP12 family chaperone protein [Xanthobacter sp. TB0139]|uniref:ATP12 family chaperone protein n=1 Tax=Xanthobacter sp. TB0139 TaxID=3459178 RepID=UPI004038FF0F
MRDLLEELEQGGSPEDPIARARAAQRPSLPKRFYKAVSVGQPDEAGASAAGYSILLDGRPVRTPARAVLQVPTRALAEAMAEEWAAQKEQIDPSTMPLTRLVNVALDRVGPEAGAVRDEVVRYAGTDMLFYRTDSPQALVERQASHWDAVLDWLREQHGARFFLAEGVMHVAQPEDALEVVRGLVPEAALPLAAIHSMTTLTGSALIALAVAQGRLNADEAWAAAHVDEDWNREQWGEDELASARREARRVEMDAAVRLLALHGA